MTRPTVSDVAELLYDAVSPLAYADAEHGYALLHICHAGTLALVTPYSWAMDDESETRPGWSVLLDLEEAPDEALDWLGQFNGSRLPDGLSEAERRSRIVSADGAERGTPGSIVAAVEPLLTGTKTVLMRERYNSATPLVDAPWHLQVTTLTSETPDPDAVEAAILTQKPAGIVLDYHTVDGQDWQSVLDNNTDWTDVDATFDTWQDVADNTP